MAEAVNVIRFFGSLAERRKLIASKDSFHNQKINNENKDIPISPR